MREASQLQVPWAVKPKEVLEQMYYWCIYIYRWMQKIYADRERTNKNRDGGIVGITC